MGTKRNTIVDEIRKYDDAKNPETSEYDVLYPKTIPSAVIDPLTNAPLSEKLAEYDEKIADGGIGEPGIGIYIYESEDGIEPSYLTDISRVKTTAGRALKRGDLLISTKGNLFEVTTVYTTTMAANLIAQLKGSSIYYSTQTSNGSGTTTLTLSNIKLPVKTSIVQADLIITASMELYRVTSIDLAGNITVEYINSLKGAKGDTGAPGTNGVTPTIKAANGSDIGNVGTPSVTASTSGTETTFTFHNLKGEKGDPGTNGTTPTIKAAAGDNINSVGTPTVTASTSGTETTFTFNNLKGATGAGRVFFGNSTMSTATRTVDLIDNSGFSYTDGTILIVYLASTSSSSSGVDIKFTIEGRTCSVYNVNNTSNEPFSSNFLVRGNRFYAFVFRSTAWYLIGQVADYELKSDSGNPVQNRVVYEALNNKMNTSNPVGTGSFSLNRKSGTNVGANSFAEGYNTTASGIRSHAEGSETTASGSYAHAEGIGGIASASGAHVEGTYYLNEPVNKASADGAHAEGLSTEASAFGAHAEGSRTLASGIASHAEGEVTRAVGANSHAGGKCTEALTYGAMAIGYATKAGHLQSFAGGAGNLTGGHVDFVIGKFNDPKTDSFFCIGGGTGNGGSVNETITAGDYAEQYRKGTVPKNVFRVNTTGATYGVGSFNSSGADYAEYIKPWFDDNIDNEDRRGYFVTIRNGKLYKAEPGDYIVGITSGNPSVIGNGDEDWLGRWERDEFNELIIKDVEVDDYVTQTDGEGKSIRVKIGSHIEHQTVQVEDYDPTQKYIERKDRPEWSCVGMIGVIPLRDDGTCEPGGFAKCRGYGIATRADEYRCHETFFVIERINDYIISVEMR